MKKNSIVIIITIIVALFAANILISRHPIRADLTQNSVYTLSDSTKQILNGLEDIVTVRVYFSNDLPPELEALRREVDDLLAEFKGVAGGRMQVDNVDPGSSVMDEQKAAMMGIPAVQLNVYKGDKAEVAKIFLGMAVMYGDRQQVIPVVQNIRNLEYDLTEAILKVASKELPKLAWWEPGRKAPEGGEAPGFNIIRESLERRYTVDGIDEKSLNRLDPKDYKELIVASPRKMSDEEIFALDQYLMNGGRLIALIDRIEVGKSLATAPVETGATGLLSNYGVTVDDSLVLDQSNATAAFSGGIVTYHIPYPFWPEVRKDQFDQNDAIASGLESVVFPWTAPLTLSGDSVPSGQAIAIAKSTDEATAISNKDARLDPQSANDAMRGGIRGAKPLAAILNGPFKSYYADGTHKAPAGMQPKLESAPESRIFVVGSSRWMDDRFLVNFPQNVALFQNAADSFAMGDLLIGIRSRDDTSRPIAIMPDGGKLFLRYANVAAGPIALAAIGVLVFFLRRSRRRRVIATYAN